MPAVAPQPQGGYDVKSQSTKSQEDLETEVDLLRWLTSPYTPVTTDILTVNTDTKNETLVITPAGTIAALTVTFPVDGSSRLGQIVRLVSHQIVTALTLTAGPTFLGTALTALAVDTAVAFQKIAANTWQRI